MSSHNNSNNKNYYNNNNNNHINAWSGDRRAGGGGGQGGRGPGRGPRGFSHEHNVHYNEKRPYDRSDGGGRKIKRQCGEDEDAQQGTKLGPSQADHWRNDWNGLEWDETQVNHRSSYQNQYSITQEEAPIAAPTVPMHRPIKQEETLVAAAPVAVVAAADAVNAPMEDAPLNHPIRMEPVPIKQEEIPMPNEQEVINLMDDDDDDDDNEEERIMEDQVPTHGQVEHHSQEALDTLRKAWIDDRNLSIAGRLEKFSQLSDRDQVMMLLPEYIPFEQLPPMRKVHYVKNTVRDISKIVKEQIQREEDQESKGKRRYEDDDTSHSSADERDGTPSVREYIGMLSICHPMTLGFRVEFASQSHNNWCYCPCDRRMVKWRELCGLEIDRCCTSKGKMSPSPLLQHLHDYGRQDAMHRLTLRYLKELFRHYLGHDIGHIDILRLEPPSQHKKAQEKRVRQAMDAETNEDIQKNMHFEDALNKAQEENKILELRNVELSQKLLDVSEKMKRKLNIDLKKVVLSIDELKFWHNESKQLLDDYRCLRRQLCRHLYKKKRNDDGMSGRIRIKVPQRFLLQEMFEMWYKSSDNDITYLMRSLNKSDSERDQFHVSRFYQPWLVEYVEAHEVDQDDIGIDHGGLKRQFVDETAKQMEDIFVMNRGKKIKLFDKYEAGFSPSIDDKFEDFLNLDEVKAFYRAIGRICALCFLHNGSDGTSNPIPIISHCFPKLFRNFLFRGFCPMDKNYDMADLVDDTMEYCVPDDDIVKHLNSEEVFKEVCKTLEIVNLEGEQAVNAIREKANNMFINQRLIALTALREGITLDGSIPMYFARLIPFQAMNRIYFAQPHLTKNNFLDGNNQWCIVHIDHDGDGSDENNVPEDVRRNQSRVIEAFKEIIEESSSEYLQHLLCFWSGYSFMPDLTIHSDFKLMIEFNLEEDLHGGSFPLAHTCDHHSIPTIKLPYNAYGGDKVAFRSKLDMAIENSIGAFQMA